MKFTRKRIVFEASDSDNSFGLLLAGLWISKRIALEYAEKALRECGRVVLADRIAQSQVADAEIYHAMMTTKETDAYRKLAANTREALEHNRVLKHFEDEKPV